MSQATVALSATTAYSLLHYIQAINGHANDQGACTWANVRGHDTNTGSVLVGDSTLTSSNYGISILAGDSRTYNNGKGCNDVDLLNKFVLGSAASQSMDLEWEYT